MKTVNQWLSELPEEIRDQAQANLGNTPAYSAGQALRLAFNWANTPEGFEYWEKICKAIEPERKCVHDWLDLFHPFMRKEYDKLVTVADPDRLHGVLGLEADTFYDAVTAIWRSVAMHTPYLHIWREFSEKCMSTQYCVDVASAIPIPEIREAVLRGLIHQAALCGSYNSAILNGGMNPSHYDLTDITQETFDLLEYYDHNFVTKETLAEHKEMLKRRAARLARSDRSDLPF